MPPVTQKKGSRLSKSTKRAVKSSGLSSAKKSALRKELRTPGVSKRESRLVKKATKGTTDSGRAYTSQQQRSVKRSNNNKGTRNTGKMR